MTLWLTSISQTPYRGVAYDRLHHINSCVS